MPRVTLDWPHLVMLLGALQGLLLAGVLVTKHHNQTANRLLAALIFTFSIFLVTPVYHAAGLVPVFPYFLGVSYPLPFLFGPLTYLYALTASDRGRTLTRADALHFVPFVLTVLAGLPIYTMNPSARVAFFETLQSGGRPLLLQIADPLKLLSGVSYATITLLFLHRHSKRVKESYSHVERVNLHWLVWLGVMAAGIWLLAIGMSFLESLGGVHVGRGDDLVALGVAVLVYAIGYMGLRQPEVFQFASSDVVLPTSETESPRYERSGLSDWEAASLKKKLLETMEVRSLWRDSELTLADLAALLHSTPHKVSEVLNSHLGQTFYDFVNGYRVREVQQRLAGERTPKLLALAMDAGFASKSTFNEVFKKHTGQTPSAYRRTAIR